MRDDDDAFNGLGGLVYSFEDATKVHGSVASKTRFPTLNELYSSFLGTATPNPNLKKEQSINYEAGVERPLPVEQCCEPDLLLFRRSRFDRKNNRAVTRSFHDNVGKARFQGFELSLKNEGLPRNTLEAHYTYLDAEDSSDNRTSDHLRESPKHQFYLSDLYKLNDWLSFFGKAQYNAGQWDQKRNRTWVELGSYWTFDVKAMVEVFKNTVAEIGVQNMFDATYETCLRIPERGENLLLRFSRGFLSVFGFPGGEVTCSILAKVAGE